MFYNLNRYIECFKWKYRKSEFSIISFTFCAKTVEENFKVKTLSDKSA